MQNAKHARVSRRAALKVAGAAAAVASSEQNIEHLSADEILADMQAHTIPGALLIPAAVGEIVRLQDKGYRLVVNG